MRESLIKVNLKKFKRERGDGIFFLSYTPLCRGSVIEYNGFTAVVQDYVVLSMYINIKEKHLEFGPYSKDHKKTVNMFAIDDLRHLDKDLIMRFCGINSFAEFVACYKESLIKDRNVFRSYVFMYLISIN